MSTQLLIILAPLLSVALVLLVLANRKLRKQKLLMQLQSREIEKRVRELVNQNHLQEELNREKQQLISVVSHDLKGPFNRIFALIQLMRMEASPLTDEQKDYLGRIHQITSDGMNMVRNLVDARKMEDQGIGFNPEKINIVSLIAPFIKQYNLLAANKQIKIQFQSPEILDVQCDKIYLSRIVENLLSNAIKFSESNREVNVVITDLGKAAELSVKDQGPGISEEDQKKLFLKFQKLTPQPTGGESSTGLGLSIVKRLVEKMKGEIHCESKLGEGAAFIVHLPKNI